MHWGNTWSPAVALKFLLACSAVVAYTWILYPLLLRLLNMLPSRFARSEGSAEIPFISIIIAAHNEQETIADKLQNCRDISYPQDRLEIMVASDGSTDRTAEIVSTFTVRDPRIVWLESDRRLGKSGIQNLAAMKAGGEIFLFTDASTRMPSGVLQTMVDDLADRRVGLVTATVFFGRSEDAVEKGQGFYWRYELFLRAAESDLGILATGSGQALLVRRELFGPCPPAMAMIAYAARRSTARIPGGPGIDGVTVYDTMPHSIEGELRAGFA